MASMDFADKSFDLIWAEGSVFIMGFENAVKSWKRLLRPKGYMVASDLVWFKEDPPDEIKDFFVKIGAQMEYYKDIYSIIESAGYKLVDYFPLPDRSWWTDFYTPLEKAVTEMKIKYKGSNDVQPIFDMLQLQMDMHKKYCKYYGYGFYVMQVK
jgi:SAM-dependent methyltransferase